MDRRLTPEHSGDHRKNQDLERTPATPPPSELAKPQSPGRPASRPKAAYQPSGRLRDKVALVAGADHGLGRAIAVLFAREGADVAIIATRSDEEGHATLEAVLAEGRSAALVFADLSSPQACRRAVDVVCHSFDHVDVVVDAAWQQTAVQPLDGLSEEQWERTLQMNAGSAFNLLKATLKCLPEGSSVLLAIPAIPVAERHFWIDAVAAQGTLEAMVRASAGLLNERGIRLNSVVCGPLWTPGRNKRAKGGTGLYPEQVAPSFVYLASSLESGFVTGQTLHLHGLEA